MRTKLGVSIEVPGRSAPPANGQEMCRARPRPICDFCSGLQVRWCYPARDFFNVVSGGPTGIVVSESVGGWAACEQCHGLIEAGDEEALLNRSVQNFVELYGFLPPTLAEDIRRIHNQFFAHRCGLAVEIAAVAPIER